MGLCARNLSFNQLRRGTETPLYNGECAVCAKTLHTLYPPGSVDIFLDFTIIEQFALGEVRIPQPNVR